MDTIKANVIRSDMAKKAENHDCEQAAIRIKNRTQQLCETYKVYVRIDHLPWWIMIYVYQEIAFSAAKCICRVLKVIKSPIYTDHPVEIGMEKSMNRSKMQNQNEDV